jgi:hypothetical protein
MPGFQPRTAGLKGTGQRVFFWLKVVSTDRSLFQREAPIFSADFVHPLSSARPIDTEMGTDMDSNTDMDKDTDTDMELE